MNLLHCTLKKAGVCYIGEIMILLFLCSFFVAATGESSCPLKTSPSRAVVRHKGSFSANCSSLSNQVDGMGWESSIGGIPLTAGVSFLLLAVKSVTVWEFEPACFMNFINGSQCQEALKVTVYKEPDRVYMSPYVTPLVEGKEYTFQCNVVNVAPVRNLSVSWHKSSGVFHTETFDDTRVYLLNMSSVVSLMAQRDDDGTEIWCEAKLNFEPTGPSPPSAKCPPVKVDVRYPPTFPDPANEELKLSADGKASLNCTAAGNPVPTYIWQFPHAIQQTSRDKNEPVLTVELAGTYTCTSSNAQGEATKAFIVTQERRSLPGTTAGILLAAFFLLIAILACVVYQKQRKSCVARPEGIPALAIGLTVGFLLLGAVIGILWFVFGKGDGKCSFSKGGDSSGPL